MTKLYDIAIIGGGILGISTAFYAKKMFPSAAIVVLEQGLIGNGATQYSAGLNLPFAHSVTKRRLTEMSQQLWPELERSLKLPINHLPLHAITIKADQFHDDEYFVNAKCEDIQFSDFSELLSLELTIPKVAKVFIGLPASYANAQLLTKLLAQDYLSTPSCSLMEGVKVNAIERQTNAYSLLLSTSPEQITAKHVVLATGPWSLNLTPALQGRTKKVVAFHINVPPKNDDPVIFFLDDDSFLLPQIEQQRWLMSLTIDEWGVQPYSNSLSITSTDSAYAQSLLVKYAPTLSPYLAGGRVFCDFYGDNRDPIVRIDGETGYVIVTGGSGSGFRLAPAIGQEACQLLRELM